MTAERLEPDFQQQAESACKPRKAMPNSTSCKHITFTSHLMLGASTALWVNVSPSLEKLLAVLLNQAQ